MSFGNAAIRTYRSAATQPPELKPQAETLSYSVRISSQAENMAQGKTAKVPVTRRKG